MNLKSKLSCAIKAIAITLAIFTNFRSEAAAIKLEHIEQQIAQRPPMVKFCGMIPVFLNEQGLLNFILNEGTFFMGAMGFKAKPETFIDASNLDHHNLLNHALGTNLNKVLESKPINLLDTSEDISTCIGFVPLTREQALFIINKLSTSIVVKNTYAFLKDVNLGDGVPQISTNEKDRLYPIKPSLAKVIQTNIPYLNNELLNVYHELQKIDKPV